MGATENNELEYQIIETAKQLFIEKGFVETSMSDIAAKVGINRPTLHYYFRTKDRMFQAVFGSIVMSLLPKVQEIIQQEQQDSPQGDQQPIEKPRGVVVEPDGDLAAGGGTDDRHKPDVDFIDFGRLAVHGGGPAVLIGNTEKDGGILLHLDGGGEAAIVPDKGGGGLRLAGKAVGVIGLLGVGDRVGKRREHAGESRGVLILDDQRFEQGEFPVAFAQGVVLGAGEHSVIGKAHRDVILVFVDLKIVLGVHITPARHLGGAVALEE